MYNKILAGHPMICSLYGRVGRKVNSFIKRFNNILIVNLQRDI